MISLAFLKKTQQEKDRKSNNLGILAKMKDLGDKKDGAPPVNLGVAMGNLMSKMTLKKEEAVVP